MGTNLKIKIFSILILLILSGKAQSQVVNLTQDYKNAIALADSGKYIVAENIFRQILDEVAQADDSVLYIKVLYQYASCQLNLKKYNEAKDHYQNTIIYYESNHKTEESDYLQSIFCQSLVFVYLKELTNAEITQVKGLKMLKEKKAGSEEYAKQLINLAEIQRALKKYDTALVTLSKAESIFSQKGTKNNINVANVLFTKGLVYLDSKEHISAEKAFKLSLQTKNNLHESDIEEELYQLGTLNIHQKKTTEANSFFERLLDLRERKYGKNSNEVASACQALAVGYSNLGFPLKAKVYMERAEEIYKGQEEENALQFSSIKAVIYVQLKEYDSAINIIRNLVQQYRKKQEVSIPYVKSLSNLGSLLVKKGQWTEAEVYLNEALEKCKAIEGMQSMHYANIIHNLANLQDCRGYYEQAEILYQECLSTTRQLSGESMDYAATLSNMGLLYKNMGRLDKAETMLLKVVELKKKLSGEESLEFANALNNLGSLFIQVGRKQKAEKSFLSAAEIIKKTGGKDSYEYASVLNNLASLYEEQERLKEALTIYNEATLIIEKVLGTTHPDYLTFSNNLALLNQKLGNFTRTEELYRKNLLLMKTLYGEDHPNYATFLSNLGGLYEMLGKYDSASIAYSKVLEIRKVKLGTKHLDYINISVNLARIASSLKNYSLADSLWHFALKEYLEKIHSLFPSFSEKEKEEFFQIVNVKIEQYYSYAFLRQKQEIAFAEKMYNSHIILKGLLLNSSKKLRENILKSGNIELIEKYRQWQKTKEELAFSYTLSVEELSEKKINISVLEKENNLKEKELSLLSDNFKDQYAVLPNYTQIRNALKSDEVLIEIIRFREYLSDSAGKYTGNIVYGAFVIKSDQPTIQFVTIDISNQLETKKISYYRNCIKHQVKDEKSFEVFWKPIYETIGSVSKVYFSPDGAYNLININTLYNIDSGKYLLEHYNIVQVSNSKDILIQKNISDLKTAIIAGNPNFAMLDSYLDPLKTIKLVPLPGTKKEIETLTRLIKKNGWQVDSYLDNQPVEERFKEKKNASLIHIATHGFFQEDLTKNDAQFLQKDFKNPLLRSGLYFAGANYAISGREAQLKNNVSPEDQILTAYEVMNLDLDQTNLVVLSACETGLGEVKNGEGVYGLQRAFQVAGVNSIIISMWKVNDETAQIMMGYFYEAYLSGVEKYSAFRNAQLKLKQDYPEPYFWGVFSMSGM